MLKVLFWGVALWAIRVGSNCLDLKSWIEMFQGWTFHSLKWKVKVKVAQLCPAVCDPMDYTVHGILQARLLEWVAYPFSRGSSQLRDWTQVSHIAGGFFYIACELSYSVVSNSLQPCGLQPARLLCPWDFLGKNTRVDCHALLQGIFPTQGLNPCFLHCKWILYQWATREA